jgi:uncharacterized protein
MLQFFFLVSFFSSVIGGICGVGGGVIIKPVLDATGTMSVSDISFLSGCTVLCMSVVSVLRNRKSKGLIEYKTGTPLAVGAILGGMLGKVLFEVAKAAMRDNNHLGAVQAILLIIVTAGTFVYSLKSSKIYTYQITNSLFCGIVGLSLGMISSFLGIGGGPINLMVLGFFFSMNAKKAAANSLYIIMLSQAASLIQSLLSHTIPSINPITIFLMAAAGILGAIVGSAVNKKISVQGVGKLFEGFMLLIIGVCTYNLIKFLLL